MIKRPGEDIGTWLDSYKFSRNQKAHYYRILRAVRPASARESFVMERQAKRDVGAQEK